MKRSPRSWAVIALFASLVLLAGSPAAEAAVEALSIDPAWVPINTPPASAVHTLRGLGFTNATSVTVDGVAANVTFVDSRTLQVEIPTSAVDKAAVIEVTEAGDTDEFFPFLYTANTFYVSKAGSDGNNGTSPATPELTIAAGLADVLASGLNGVVKVAGGTYDEAGLAVFTGTVISGGWSADFTQHDPDEFVTVIDGQKAGFVIRSGGLDSAQVIDGVTVTNGERDGLGGGGIVISGDSTVVSNSVFVGNTTSSIGGGIYTVFTTSYGGRPSVSNSVVIGNRSFSNTGGGIGIYPFYTLGNLVDVAISDNYILGNRSFNNRGGGVGLVTQPNYSYNILRAQMVGNVLAHNSALSGGGASFIAAGGGDNFTLVLDNNLFHGNVAAGEGGGLLLTGVGHINGRISGSTFSGNSAGPGGGGGLRLSPSLFYEPTFEAENLIAWSNTNLSFSGAPVITYSNIEGGATGTGNINQDPEFRSGPMGSFYLAQDPNVLSPSVDAGSDLASALSMEARTTSVDQLPDSGLVDMGFHYTDGVGPSALPLQFGRIDPPRGDVSGTDWVLLRGKGFDPGVSVTFDGLPATDQIYVSEKRILALAPPHAMGAVDVEISNPDMETVLQPSAYTYADTLPPAWPTTVGLQAITASQDCVRSAVLTWNPAVEAVTPPVTYTIYREECIPSIGNFRLPCDNYGYFPNGTNLLATTTETFYTDVDFGNQDKKWIYLVRAVDAATPQSNHEFNYSKRLALVADDPADITPPAEIGDTLDIATADFLDWAGAVGSVAYNLYRETDPSAYASPGSLTPFMLLDSTTNDVNGDGVADSSYIDSQIPAVDTAFFYRVTALDPCGLETVAELVP